VRYASLAGDYEKCVELILNAGGWKIILINGIGYMRTLLRFIPDHILKKYPRMLMARAYLYCKDGDPLQGFALLDQAGDIEDSEATHREYVDRIVVKAMLDVYSDGWDLRRHGEKIRKRDPKLAAMGYLEAGTLKCEEVTWHFRTGDLEAASTALRQAFRFKRQSGSVLGLNYCYLHAATASIYRGEFDMAEANITRALELAESNFGSDSGLKHMATILDYSLKAWRGVAKKEDLDVFSEMLTYIEENDGWTEIFLVGLDAVFHLAKQCKEHQFASDVADRFLKVAERRSLERLENFALVLKREAEYSLGRNQAAPMLPERMIIGGEDIDRHAFFRDWQIYTLAAIYLFDKNSPLFPASPAFLETVEPFLAQINSPFYMVRFNIAYARILAGNNQKTKAHEKLRSAVEMAEKRKFYGPFLLYDDIDRLLNDLRHEMRADEDALLAVNFISHILIMKKQSITSRSQVLLSGREQEILEQLALGQSNKQIARKLELTENTVKFHLKNIFPKLGVNKRTQAIVSAQKLGLLD